MSYPSTQYIFGFNVSELLTEQADSKVAWALVKQLGIDKNFTNIPETTNPLTAAQNGCYLHEALAGSPLHFMSSQQTAQRYLILGVEVTTGVPEFPNSFELADWKPNPLLLKQAQALKPWHSPTLHYLCGY
jgi:hypothetical protein